MANGGTSVARRAEVERIVREVLAEMAGGPQRPTPAGGELVLSNKVVSAEVLEKKIEGLSRVVVPRGAVVTPAARDLLREHQVAIASAVVTPQAADRWQVVVGVADTGHEPASLMAALGGENLNVERLPQIGMIHVVDELCEQVVKGEKLGLVFTEQTAAALCLANRRQGVRAALGCDVESVAAAAATVAANVLVIHPKGKSLFEWKRIVRTWIDGAGRSCPAELRERLG